MRPHRQRRPRAAAEIVAEVLAEQEGRANGRKEAMTVRVFRAFSRLGPPITRHAEPVQFRAGVLTLSVDDSGWLTELTFLRPEILQRMAGLLGKPWVKDVRLRHAPLGRAEELRPQKQPMPVLAPEDEATVAGWAAEIADPEIRDAMLRAARRAVSTLKRRP